MAEFGFGVKASPKYLDPPGCAHRDLVNGNQRSSRYERIDEFRQSGCRGQSRFKSPSPLTEYLRNFIGVLLGDVLIRAGSNPAENVIQRRFRGIMRR